MSRRIRVTMEVTRVTPLYGWIKGLSPEPPTADPDVEAQCLTYIAAHPDFRIMDIVESGAFNVVIAVYENPLAPQYFLARLVLDVRVSARAEAPATVGERV